MKGIRIIFQVVNGDEAVSIQSSRIVPVDQLPDCESLEASAAKYAKRFWDSFAAVRQALDENNLATATALRDI